MPNFNDDFEISFSTNESEMLHLTNTHTGETTRLTLDEALSWLTLMLRHQDELRTLKFGQS